MYSTSSLTNKKRRFKRRLKSLVGLDHSIDQRIEMQKERLGTIYGGWWVATSPLRKIKQPTVLSFGIGQDISFDLEIIEKYGAQVYAFDPTPLSLNWLEAQTDLPASFHAYQYGIADFDGSIKLGMPSRADWDDYSVLRAETGAAISCPVKKLSTICRELEIEHIDVLKLDVEGSEYAALPDVLSTRIRPTQILVEYHYGDKASVNATIASIAALESAGYSIIDVSPWGREFTMVLRG